ncbi:hypothetical protein PIB30_076102 [Stylosanthes scabra]|uniref:Myb/SANT-like domain-containing protein n=1 Tax=Stylosanthes scabra TaxID=79078 RepID=A0ABU6YST3_9FABA|nr:hypothetical protein [Stylosanthes scabra]
MDVDPEDESGILDAFRKLETMQRKRGFKLLRTPQSGLNCATLWLLECLRSGEQLEALPVIMDKRMGSDEETKAFVGFMEEFVVDSTQPDCGQFRTMTFEELALKIIERFPNCILTAKHCKNKHKQMKEKYQYAANMLACSGFGWNEEKQSVEVDSRDVLDAWMKDAKVRIREFSNLDLIPEGRYITAEVMETVRVPRIVQQHQPRNEDEDHEMPEYEPENEIDFAAKYVPRAVNHPKPVFGGVESIEDKAGRVLL